MTLQVLRGKIASYKRKRGRAEFVFDDSDRAGLGVIAIGAGLAGLSGQAISTVNATASTDEEADFLEFDVNGQPVKGWVWRSPFKEGDEVEVVCEQKDGFWEVVSVARPADRIIALYPHCSRGQRSHWNNAWTWWFKGTWVFLLASVVFLELSLWLIGGESAFFGKGGLYFSIFFPAFFFPVFALMTWSLARKWMPFVRLSEKVFTALGWENPGKVDLVKSSKAQRTPNDPPEFGVFYFRY